MPKKIVEIGRTTNDGQGDALKNAFAKVNENIDDIYAEKQDALVSGSSIKTINGNSVLGSGDLVISGGSGGLQGIHYLTKGITGASTNSSIYSFALSNSITSVANRLVLYPFIPNNSLTSASLYISVSTLVASSNARILIYSNLNGVPDTKLYESTNLDCSTTGIKRVTTTQTFNAGTTYWIGVHTSSTQGLNAISSSNMIPIYFSSLTVSNQYFITATFGSAPTTFGTVTTLFGNAPAVGITI
jgi:hypothetical protein